MQVSSTNPEADAGLHFIILVDDLGRSVVPPIAVNPNNGAYTFTITDVPVGSYRLFGGSDMDNDGFLCDAGEACGAFRNLDAPEVLNVNANVTPQMTDLDFVSEFRAVISGQAQSNAAGATATGGIRYRGTPDSRQPTADKQLEER
jgi:serine protease